jgi:hypothetical protein
MAAGAVRSSSVSASDPGDEGVGIGARSALLGDPGFELSATTMVRAGCLEHPPLEAASRQVDICRCRKPRPRRCSR